MKTDERKPRLPFEGSTLTDEECLCIAIYLKISRDLVFLFPLRLAGFLLLILPDPVCELSGEKDLKFIFANCALRVLGDGVFEDPAVEGLVFLRL